MAKVERSAKPDEATPLKRGWTTGACATAATKAALSQLLTGKFPDPVEITLPKGETPAFALAVEEAGDGFARAGIIKDAGDDPDVTHGATIIATVQRGARGAGISFSAGPGVGMVTKAGLPVPPGNAAINPVPRQMMTQVVTELCKTHDCSTDFIIEISVLGGREIAEKTWNPRLGILGGISILGTTGIVHPYSCSAWIHSIHRGIDVARANDLPHVLAATGSTSEGAANALYGLPDFALLDMGDFAGGVLKYLRAHPVPKLTLAGGFAKMTKLAQGALDLHSGRSQIDKDFLASLADEPRLTERIQNANTAAEILELTQQNNIDLAPLIAKQAKKKVMTTLENAPVDVELIIVDRTGKIIAHEGFKDA